MMFDPHDQGNVAKAAAELMHRLEGSLPRVPWLSNSGQQKAFQQIVQMVIDGASALDANPEATNAVVFWTLTILYANKKPFRLATASVKNWGAAMPSPIAASFVSWTGSNIHPGEAVLASMSNWEKSGEYGFL
ncbi:MAG: hypothetical protein GXP38_05045 [Chloroflexi bacterium]|nr:hypothetical protein [Chloroflexota bacterium]